MKNFSNPYLEWLDENQKTLRLEIIDRVFIGRLCKGIDEKRRIIVRHSMVSRDHAEIILSGSRLKIKDVSKKMRKSKKKGENGAKTEEMKEDETVEEK